MKFIVLYKAVLSFDSLIIDAAAVQKDLFKEPIDF